MTLTDRSGRAIEIPDRDIISLTCTYIDGKPFTSVAYEKKMPGDKQKSIQYVIVKECSDDLVDALGPPWAHGEDGD